MNDESKDGAVTTLKMRDVGCVSMEFDLEVPLDKFDLEAFRRELASPADTKREARVCSTGNPQITDYHVHFSWRFIEDKAALSFTLDYIGKVTKPYRDERAPFAEDVMEWLGKFCTFADVSAEISTQFKYDGKKLAMLPLPMKMTAPRLDVDVEVFGIAFNMPAQQPSGTNRVYVSQYPGHILLTCTSERRLNLHLFSMPEQLKLQSAFVERLVIS